MKMGAREKIAFLEGLLEGLDPKGDPERKIYFAVVEALHALVDEIDDHEEILEEHRETIEDLSEYCEQLEEDMERLEGDLDDVDDLLEDEPGETFDSLECPECGHVFFFKPEARAEDGALQCPECGFVIQD